MDNEFCQALAANDRSAIQRVVDDFLNGLHTQDEQQNFEKIENWITSHDCIDSVEVPSYLIDTAPPIKEFIVKLHGTSQPVTLGILLNKDRWQFHRR
jgi:hypothetical protein